MKKILIVEDEPDQAKALLARLSASGFQVLTVHNAKDGIRLAQEEKPDLILLDMLLPGMNGIEAAKQLRLSPETIHTPIIAMTAIGTRDIEEICSRAGINDFIRKPYETEDLLNKVNNNLL